MNKLVIFFISGVLFSLLVTCKTKKVEPVIVEKTIFENISLCDKPSMDYYNNYPDIKKAIKSDTIILKNIKGKFFLGLIGGLEFDKSLIDPIRYPTWGKGHVLAPCNVPLDALTDKKFDYNIEFDCIFYQWDLGNRNIDFWPVALTRLKVLNKIEAR